MAKGIGLIGNFKGKVGNMVGYKLSDSNTGNSQGIRVYQPIVRNPKTSAQAEQRAKLAPINATYRALKMIIDRGNEGLPYGNKSRLAWLKQAFKAETMPWYEKGAVIENPVPCRLTKGSLMGLEYEVTNNLLTITCQGITDESAVDTVGKVSTLLMAGYPHLKAGDQITFIFGASNSNGLYINIHSIILDPTSTEATSLFQAETGVLEVLDTDADQFGAVIISREGANGEHLRSSASLIYDSSTLQQPPFDEASKTAAIASYQSSASANADWAEESIQ